MTLPSRRPWRIEDLALVDASGRRVGWTGYARNRGVSLRIPTEEQDANRALILRAVNERDDLVVLLDEAYTLLEKQLPGEAVCEWRERYRALREEDET